jgi:LemA protein
MALDIVVGFVIAVAAAFAIGLILVFNSLVVARQRVKNAWSQIDVQLKRRADLVFNLVETVKGYEKHEKSVFEDVARMRTGVKEASAPSDVIASSNALTAGLRSVFAVAEGYPQLRANENFMQLQRELVALEDSIAKARMVYNDVVTIYNIKVMSFPQNLVARPLGFTETKQLEADEIDRAPVKVKL